MYKAWPRQIFKLNMFWKIFEFGTGTDMSIYGKL